MVVLQTLNKILKTGDMHIVVDNNLSTDMFIEYQEEFNFINNFYNQYGKVPDKETFLNNFPEFNLIEVTESDKYLVDKINEEYLYYRAVPVIQQTAELMKTNSNDAVTYLLSQIPKLTGSQKSIGVDIIENATLRLNEYKERIQNKDKQYIPSGFEELDNIFNGFCKGEELVVLFARIGQGKSWILNKMLSHAWELGYNVGLISPEMSATKIGYRFDTLIRHFSNKNLNWRPDANRL